MTEDVSEGEVAAVCQLIDKVADVVTTANGTGSVMFERERATDGSGGHQWRVLINAQGLLGSTMREVGKGPTLQEAIKDTIEKVARPVAELGRLLREAGLA